MSGAPPVAQFITNLPANAGDTRSVDSNPRWRSPGEGNGTPHQCSCLEDPMDRGAWRAAVHGVAQNRTRLSRHAQDTGQPCSLRRCLPAQGSDLLSISRRVGEDAVHICHGILLRRRQWHPTPVLLPGKSHGWRSLVGCSPWGH